MHFTPFALTAVLACCIGLAMAAPAEKNAAEAETDHDIMGKLAPHPKLQQLQEGNYTLNQVLDVLQEEHEMKP